MSRSFISIYLAFSLRHAPCARGFTTRLNFKLSDRVPADKIALAEGGIVLFETRSIDMVRGTTEWKLWRGEFITITLKLNLPHLEKKVGLNLTLSRSRLMAPNCKI